MDSDTASNSGESLAEKLDKQLEEYVSKLERKQYKGGFSEANWEQEMQEHPVFRTEPLKEGEELPPLVEALQQLKYDPEENTAEELARNYKEDGNNNFKLKKYRWAIDAYTEGIKIGCESELTCQLYTNRAAAHYHLGNFRSSLGDCECALKYKKDHMKAIIRGAQCCQHLGRHDETLKWCDRGLQINSNEDLLTDIKKKTEQDKKIWERDRRKVAVREKKTKAEDEKLLKIIEERGIQIAKDENSEEGLTLASLEPCHPSALGSKVHLDEQDLLIWPVIFIYPEYAQTDYIQNFGETTNFVHYLNAMFGVERPNWDTENTYHPGNLKIYFEEKATNTLWEVDPDMNLLDVLKYPRYVVLGGTPSFFITANQTEFDYDFVKKYNTSDKLTSNKHAV